MEDLALLMIFPACKVSFTTRARVTLGHGGLAGILVGTYILVD
jgi:hypothetical protein